MLGNGVEHLIISDMQEKQFPEQDELVLCTVDKIVETTVFVKIDHYNKEGVISTSEVAPGRIRNIRDYVRPGKKIVCKVLRIYQDTGHIDLSLRRVSQKERLKVMSDFEREKNDFAILKSFLKEKTESVVEKIKKEYESIPEFMQKASKEDYKKFGFNEQEAEQLLKIINEKPEKRVSVKAKMTITSESGDGIIKIKNILLKAIKSHKDTEITYISAQNYSITVTSSDYKKANTELDAIISEVTGEAKASGVKTEAVKQ